MMFGPKKGTWWYHSDSDPRWNLSGTADFFSVFVVPAEAKAALDEKQKELNEIPPIDLIYNCMKD